MNNLEEILGIDPSDPEMMRAMALAEGDHQFLRGPPKLSTIRRYAQVVGILITHRVEVDTGQLRHQAGLDRSQDAPGSEPPARPELNARASPPGR